MTTFNIGDRVVIRNPDEFQRHVASAVRGRIGVVQKPPHESLRCMVYVKWEPKPRDRAMTIHKCPGWCESRWLEKAPEVKP